MLFSPPNVGSCCYKRNVYWNFTVPRSKAGRNRLSISSQPRLITTNKSLPGLRIQRKRLWTPRMRESLSNCTKFAQEIRGEKLMSAPSSNTWVK